MVLHKAKTPPKADPADAVRAEMEALASRLPAPRRPTLSSHQRRISTSFSMSAGALDRLAAIARRDGVSLSRVLEGLVFAAKL